MSHKTVRQAVTEQIAQAVPAVQDRVVQHFVEKEVARRADIITRGLDKHQELQRERAKTNKPDAVTYNADGSVASEGYTKDRIEANKKADEKLAKYERALDKAIEGDVSDLSQLINQ